jgi:hypothetical protein
MFILGSRNTGPHRNGDGSNSSMGSKRITFWAARMFLYIIQRWLRDMVWCFAASHSFGTHDKEHASEDPVYELDALNTKLGWHRRCFSCCLSCS